MIGRAMTRQAYTEMRSAYRTARRADAQWRPCPYAARNTRQTPPDHAARFIARLPVDLVETFMRPFTVLGHLPRGPKAEAIYQRRAVRILRTTPTAKQIALANGIRAMEAIRMEAA